MVRDYCQWEKTKGAFGGGGGFFSGRTRGACWFPVKKISDYRISSNSSTPRNNRAPRNKRPWRKGFESISAPPEFAAHGRLLNLQQTCSARSTSVYTCTARNGFLLRHHCGFLEVFRSQTCHRSPPILFLLSWKLYTDNTLKSIGVRGTRPLNRYRPTTNRVSKIRRAPRIKRAPRNKRAPSRSFELIAAQGYYSRT